MATRLPGGSGRRRAPLRRGWRSRRGRSGVVGGGLDGRHRIVHSVLYPSSFIGIVESGAAPGRPDGLASDARIRQADLDSLCISSFLRTVLMGHTWSDVCIRHKSGRGGSPECRTCAPGARNDAGDSRCTEVRPPAAGFSRRLSTLGGSPGLGGDHDPGDAQVLGQKRRVLGRQARARQGPVALEELAVSVAVLGRVAIAWAMPTMRSSGCSPAGGPDRSRSGAAGAAGGRSGACRSRKARRA